MHRTLASAGAFLFLASRLLAEKTRAFVVAELG